MASPEDILRFEWGICAVCGIETPEGPSFHQTNYIKDPHTGEVLSKPGDHVVANRSMLCEVHQQDYSHSRSRVGFHAWVRNHKDSHLLFHEFEMECPVCIPCPVCEENLPMENDYLCFGCRYG